MGEFSDANVAHSACTVCGHPIFWQTDVLRGGPGWEHSLSFLPRPHLPVSAEPDPDGS